MGEKNKLHSVTESTRDIAKFDAFCAVSEQKFSILFLFLIHYDYLLHSVSRNSWYLLWKKEDYLSLYYTKLERPHIFILQLGLDLLDGKFPQKWIARGVPSARHPYIVSSVVRYIKMLLKFYHCPTICRNLLGGFDLLHLKLHPPCLQMCGLNLNLLLTYLTSYDTRRVVRVALAEWL
jgi:hypothetical protein